MFTKAMSRLLASVLSSKALLLPGWRKWGLLGSPRVAKGHRNGKEVVWQHAVSWEGPDSEELEG